MHMRSPCGRLISSLLALAVQVMPLAASANHTNDDQCPDVHVSGSNIATQSILIEGPTTEKALIDQAEVPQGSSLTVQAVHTTTGYCDIYTWDPGGQQCVYTSTQEKGLSIIKGQMNLPDGSSGVVGQDFFLGPGNTPSMDSSDDATTTAGAVTDAWPLTQIGQYEHYTTSALSGTVCLIPPNSVQSEIQVINVVDPDEVKDLRYGGDRRVRFRKSPGHRRPVPQLQ